MMLRSSACRCALRIDRAGLVGADGATHAGSFDVAYLGCLPDFVIMAAADEAELVHMVATQAAIDDRPSALRYPRGEGTGVELPKEGVPLEIGKGRILRQGSKVALLSLGTRLGECLRAADQLAGFGLSTTVADARFAKPLDKDLIKLLAQNHEVLVTVEEGSVGGFGSFVLHYLSDEGLLDHGLKVRTKVLPDVFIDHGKPDAMYDAAGLAAAGIVETVFKALGRDKPDRRTWRPRVELRGPRGLKLLTSRVIVTTLRHRPAGYAACGFCRRARVEVCALPGFNSMRRFGLALAEMDVIGVCRDGAAVRIGQRCIDDEVVMAGIGLVGAGWRNLHALDAELNRNGLVTSAPSFGSMIKTLAPAADGVRAAARRKAVAGRSRASDCGRNCRFHSNLHGALA